MSKEYDPDAPTTLDDGVCLAIYRRMKLVRAFDEKIDTMRRTDKIAGRRRIFAGEEAVAVGAIHALRNEDVVVSTYHQWGHRLARGFAPHEVVAEVIGDVNEHWRNANDSATATQSRTYYIDTVANGARGLSIAAGLALAIQYRNEAAAVCCLFGDGALSHGAFHEALNAASIMNLPIVLVCENNFFGMGMFIDSHACQEELCRLGIAYKIEAARVDGMDALQVYAATAKAAARARDGDGPSLIEAVTYRYRSSTFSDGTDYDARRDEPIWRERDPILNLRTHLIGERSIPEEQLDQIDREVSATIDDAMKFAEQKRASRA